MKFFTQCWIWREARSIALTKYEKEPRRDSGVMTTEPGRNGCSVAGLTEPQRVDALALQSAGYDPATV